jgi:5-methylcytosine-specific restriction endonuclease McrA
LVVLLLDFGKYKEKMKAHGWAVRNAPNASVVVIKQIRASWKYRQWRQHVFIKNDFSCVECGYSGKSLHAHHKKPFFELIREAIYYLPLYSAFESAMAYVPLWNIDNGKTLCISCHKKEHAKKLIDHKKGR